MNTCKDCKWWHPDDAVGYCGSLKIVDDQDKEPSGDEFAMYMGVFCTGPDFGCIHWEQK